MLFQDPPYASVSDDPTEEKMDDSALQWDQMLEFEDDFQLDCTFGSGLRGHRSGDKTRAKERRTQVYEMFLYHGMMIICKHKKPCFLSNQTPY